MSGPDLNDTLRNKGREGVDEEFAKAKRHERKGNGAAGADGKTCRFPLRRLSDIKPTLHGLYSIKGLLPRTGLVAFYGPPKEGKTFVALSVAVHMALGREWCGRKVKQGAVVYICAEGGTGFDNRAVLLRAKLNLPEDTPFFVISVAPDLGSKTGDADALIEEIRQQTGGIPIAAIVIDTLARATPGMDENSVKEMGIFVANADKIAKAFDGLTIAVHHTPKSSNSVMRGSSALHGATECEWEVTLKDGIGTIRIAAFKDGEAGQKWTFKICPSVLGRDEDGDFVSAGFIEFLTRPGQKSAKDSPVKKPLKGKRKRFFDAVKKAISEAGITMPGSNHIPANRRGVQREDLKRYTALMGLEEGKTEENKRRTRNRYIADLAGDGYLGSWGEWVWTL